MLIKKKTRRRYLSSDFGFEISTKNYKIKSLLLSAVFFSKFSIGRQHCVQLQHVCVGNKHQTSGRLHPGITAALGFQHTPAAVDVPPAALLRV